jgi:hypothetical protein
LQDVVTTLISREGINLALGVQYYVVVGREGVENAPHWSGLLGAGHNLGFVEEVVRNLLDVVPTLISREGGSCRRVAGCRPLQRCRHGQSRDATPPSPRGQLWR